jgi:hypothetical protein
LSVPALRALAAVLSLAALTALIAPMAAGAGAAQPTREEYVATADSICRTSLQRAKKLFRKGIRLIKEDREERGARKMIKAWRHRDAGFDKVRKLERPAGDEATLERWLDLEAKATKLSIRTLKAFADDRPQRAGKLRKRARTKHKRAALVVRGFGFERCSGSV